MKKILVLLLLIILANTCQAVDDDWPADVPRDADVKLLEDTATAPEEIVVETDLSIERIVPESVNAGEIIEVKLRVVNNHDETLNLVIVESQRDGVNYIEVPEVYTVNYQALAVPLMKWEDTISPGGVKEYTYKMSSVSPGAINLPPATVSDDYGNSYESAKDFIEVLCSPDGVCGEDENYLYCPEDCQTGTADDVCDGVDDGRIDPDCSKGFDPDESAKTLSDRKQTDTKDSKSPCMMLALPLFSLAIAFILKT